MFTSHTATAENLEKPRDSRALARAAQSTGQGRCVRPKHHLRAFLIPHTPKMRTRKTAGQIGPRLETTGLRFRRMAFVLRPHAFLLGNNPVSSPTSGRKEQT